MEGGDNDMTDAQSDDLWLAIRWGAAIQITFIVTLVTLKILGYVE